MCAANEIRITPMQAQQERTGTNAATTSRAHDGCSNQHGTAETTNRGTHEDGSNHRADERGTQQKQESRADVRTKLRANSEWAVTRYGEYSACTMCAANEIRMPSTCGNARTQRVRSRH